MGYPTFSIFLQLTEEVVFYNLLFYNYIYFIYFNMRRCPLHLSPLVDSKLVIGLLYLYCALTSFVKTSLCNISHLGIFYSLRIKMLYRTKEKN